MSVGGGEHERGEVASWHVPGVRISAVFEGVSDEIRAAGLCGHEQGQVGDVLRRSLRKSGGGGDGEEKPRGGWKDSGDERLDAESDWGQISLERNGRRAMKCVRAAVKLGIQLAAIHLVNPDIVRWNEKYRAASDDAFAQPDELLVAHQALLAGDGRVLDVACGAGANAIVAAERGGRVVGVDASFEGLRIAAHRATAAGVSLSLLNADLDAWRPPPECFDLVMVFRYLNRGLFSSLQSAIRPGGVVIYKTFNRNFLEHKPDMNPDYLLEPGELARCFSAFDEIATNDGSANREVSSWWIGRKPVP